ncbi:MAG: PKD domain-containing protein [Flavobacteriales bacterium]|nr:PKD domain-containing protein [Flavobacteriales bacterium]
MKKILVLLLLIPFATSAQQFSLVKDFNNEVTSNGHDPENGGVVWNNLFIYAAKAQSCGLEPWVSDGTADGTQLLKDIRPGVGFSEPEDFAITPNGVVFSAYSVELGRELYITEGTPEGTQLLIDLYPGETSSSAAGMITFNDHAYFSAFHPEINGTAIYRTDGTAEGTELFFDDNGVGSVGFIQAFVWNEKLFLSITSTGNGTEPWVTDGTEEGTMLLLNIAPGTDSSNPGLFTPFGEDLIFRAYSSSVGNEPYITDGTPEGTTLLKNINSGSGNSMVDSFVELKGELLFSAQDASSRQVWKTDGTVQISEISASSTQVAELIRIQDNVYFRSNSDDVGRELFVTDGTTEGTTNVTDINPGADDSEVEHLAVLNDVLYFKAEQDGFGAELWTYDPATEALNMIDIISGDDGSFPYFFHQIGDKLFFAGYDGLGYEPFITDGTEEGTFALADFNATGTGVSGLFFVNLEEKALFVGLIGNLVDQLATTDGTEDGTEMLTDYQGEDDSRIRHLTVFDDQLFFRADDGISGAELWVSDGTTEGTVLHTDVSEGFGNGGFIRMDATDSHLVFEGYQAGGGSQVHSLGLGETNSSLTLDIWAEGQEDVEQMTKVGNEFFFRANDSSGFGASPDLWKTDGTVKVKDFPAYGINPDDFVEASGKLWFFAGEYSTSSDWGLYTSDGTDEGTYQVKYFNFQEDYQHPYNVAGYNGGILFTAWLDGVGNEVYYSDGTEEGTNLVTTIWPGEGDLFTYNFVEVDGISYFITKSPEGGAELWRTDATEAGTYQVADIAEGVEDGVLDLRNFENTIETVNGLLFFAGKTEEGEFELFVSDGTDEGTGLLADINPNGSSNPHTFFAASDYVYFIADHASFGSELWRTNGTVTEMVGDIAPNALSSLPNDLKEWGDFLYFSATDGDGSRNLYKYDQRCIIPEVAALPESICLGETLSVSAEVLFSTDEEVSATWEFGDDTDESSLVATHTYVNSGNWEVSLTLTNAGGCEAIQTFNVSVLETPQADFAAPLSELCLSETWEPMNLSTLTTDQTTWSWQVNDNEVSTVESPQINFESTGELTVTLLASNEGCGSETELMVDVYVPVTIEEVIVGVDCFGDETGSYEVEGIGMGESTTYSSDGITFSGNNSWENLPGGNFTYFIQDGEGCIGEHVAVIPESDELVTDYTSVGDDGTGIGSIDVDVTGGEAPYEFSIDGIAFQTTSEFTDLLAGDYSITIIDALGCETTLAAVVDLVDGLSELEIQGVRVYPNPASQTLNIVLESLDVSNVKVLDMKGRVIASYLLKSGTNQLDVSSIASGVYLLQLGEGNNVMRLQILR